MCACKIRRGIRNIPSPEGSENEVCVRTRDRGLCATLDCCVGLGTVGVCSSMISSLVNPENDRIKILRKDYLVEMGMLAHKALNKCEYELGV